MDLNIKFLIESTDNQVWNSQIKNFFYALQDEINPEFIPVLEKFINENKNPSITKISLETLNFYRQVMSAKQIENINQLIQKVIETDDYSLDIKKEAIVQRGYFNEWPDMLLREVLEKSNERELKIFAFRSILTELQLPHQVIDLETSLVITDEIEPTFDRINEITQARADGKFDHLNPWIDAVVAEALQKLPHLPQSPEKRPNLEQKKQAVTDAANEAVMFPQLSGYVPPHLLRVLARTAPVWGLAAKSGATMNKRTVYNLEFNRAGNLFVGDAAENQQLGRQQENAEQAREKAKAVGDAQEVERQTKLFAENAVDVPKGRVGGRELTSIEEDLLDAIEVRHHKQYPGLTPSIVKDIKTKKLLMSALLS